VAGEPGKSLKIVLTGEKVGVWSDFEGSVRGGDLLDLWMAIRNLTLYEAMLEAADHAHVTLDGKESRPKRSYTRPERPRNARKPQGRVMAYLQARGLSEATLDDFQIGELENQWILFPYKRTRDGELINTKYLHIDRDNGKKQMRQEKEAEPCLFGWNALRTRYPDTRYVSITEGECFPGNAQVLTENGWIELQDYTSGRVAQWNQDGTIEFVYPFARIQKEFSGKLIEYSNKSFYSLTTPDHNLISRNEKIGYYKHTANQGSKQKADTIPRCGVCNGDGIPLTNMQIALCIAVSADAAIDIRKQNCYNGRFAIEDRYARMAFKKERKINRIRSILQECNIVSSDNWIANGCRSICFGIPDWVPGRFFPMEWLVRATAQQREFILEELIHWDGNSVPDRTMTEYSTKHRHNAEFVQAMCHLSGRCSSIVERSNQFGSWLKVTILNSKKESSWQRLERRDLTYHKPVYCLQVPSGALLIRQFNRITVSGNCDAMSLHQCGIPALSVPNGGGGGRKQDWIENDYDYLEQFDTIYLCLDNDPAGKEAEKEIIKRLGTERCRVVTLPYKDSNECLMKGIVNFSDYFYKAKSFDPEELKSAFLFTDSVLDKFYPAPNTYHGMKSPWENFNKAMTFQREELIVWSGFSGSGKSTLLNHVVAQGLLQDEKFAICSMEMPSKTTLYRMVRQFTGEKCPTSDRIYNTMHWLNDKLWMIDVLGVMKVERMLEVIKYAVKRYNIRNFIIDSLTKCGIREDDYDGQKALVDALTDFCHQYECTVHLVVHQRKPISAKERPDKFGARGAAAITDEANSVICVYRNSADGDQDQFKRRKIVETTPHLDQPDTIISIEKNRETGIEGKFDLYFDADSLQFHEVRQAPIDYTLQIESTQNTSTIVQEEF
jgi:KaiC/GvpD/RAD55 family RecA-like ATPase